MELCEFQDNIYGKYKGRLFVFERDWGAFRPIQFVGWNGSQFEIVDAPYCNDIFDPYYGYGSKDMKTVCDHLSRTTELEGARVIKDPHTFWAWCGHIDRTVWWRDRPMLFTSKCVSTTPSDWKNYLSTLQTRPKTLKRSIRARMITKRLLPK